MGTSEWGIQLEEDGLLALPIRVGLHVLPQMMAAEVEQLAAPQGKRQAGNRVSAGLR